MANFSRRLAAIVGMSGLLLLLVPNSFTYAQSVAPRTRGGEAPHVAAVLSPAQPVSAPEPTNMLQEPAREAQVAFSGDRLSIHAENASLSAILRQVAAQSGMKITGLGGDERVFGTFGPGAPSDVLGDLLNGTAYDVVLIGNASYGAPRELILTPSKTGALARSAAPSVGSQTIPDEVANDQESQDTVPPPPDAPPASAVPPGVRTPQQLFQQLQQMRQAQQQQVPQQEQQQTTTQPPPQ